MSDNTIEAAIAELEGLPIGPLRKQAATLYGINVTKEMEREDIIAAIRARTKRSDFAFEAKGDMPKPGWARITLLNMPGEPTRAQVFTVNGYRCSVPKGIEVDVPIKLYRAIKNARRKRLEEDKTEAVNSPKRWRWIESDAYPCTLHALTEGPDPKPGHERTKEAKLRPYHAFMKRYGYWPTASMVKQAIIDGRLDGFKAGDLETRAVA